MAEFGVKLKLVVGYDVLRWTKERIKISNRNKIKSKKKS